MLSNQCIGNCAIMSTAIIGYMIKSIHIFGIRILTGRGSRVNRLSIRLKAIVGWNHTFLCSSTSSDSYDKWSSPEYYVDNISSCTLYKLVPVIDRCSCSTTCCKCSTYYTVEGAYPFSWWWCNPTDCDMGKYHPVIRYSFLWLISLSRNFIEISLFSYQIRRKFNPIQLT